MSGFSGEKEALQPGFRSNQVWRKRHLALRRRPTGKRERGQGDLATAHWRGKSSEGRNPMGAPGGNIREARGAKKSARRSKPQAGVLGRRWSLRTGKGGFLGLASAEGEETSGRPAGRKRVRENPGAIGGLVRVL